MGFKKGEGGRPHGAVNILTKTVKEVVLETFNKLQQDKEHNLYEFAKKRPDLFYPIAAKLIPTDIKASVNVTSINLNIERKTSNPVAIDPPSEPAIDAGPQETL